MTLQLVRISFQFPTTPPKQIFTDASVTVESGKLNFVVGRNGSGKTTLLRMISGEYDREYQGSIIVDNTYIDSMDVFNRAKYILKIDEDVMNILVPHFTVWEHLALASFSENKLSRIHSAKMRFKDGIVQELYSRFPILKDVWNARIYQLSSGVQQSVALAMLYIRRPKVALLDEPTVNLDFDACKRFLETLTGIIKDNNVIVLIVCHDLILVSRYADCIFIINQGKIQKLEIESRGAIPAIEIAKVMGIC